MTRETVRLVLANGSLAAPVTEAVEPLAVACGGRGDVELALRDLLARVQAPPSARIQVLLGAPHVQLRTLRGLPPMRRNALRQMVATTPDRFFRRGGRLCVDADWVRSGPALVARAAAADGDLIDAVEAAVLSLDRGVATVGVLNAPSGLGFRGEAGNAAARRRSRRRAVTAALTVLAVLCGAAVYDGTVLQRDNAALARDIDAIAPIVRAVRATQAEQRAMDETVEAVGASSAAHAVLVTDVARTLITLPSGAYLTSADLAAEGAGELRGFAARPRDVLRALDSIHPTVRAELKTDLGVTTSEPGAWVPFVVRWRAR